MVRILKYPKHSFENCTKHTLPKNKHKKEYAYTVKKKKESETFTKMKPYKQQSEHFCIFSRCKIYKLIIFFHCLKLFMVLCHKLSFFFFVLQTVFRGKNAMHVLIESLKDFLHQFLCP